jgi:hypothetical protein
LFIYRLQKRIYGCPIHIDIKTEKFGFRDFTEAGIAHAVVERGVPKSEIVLSFRSSILSGTLVSCNRLAWNPVSFIGQEATAKTIQGSL